MLAGYRAHAGGLLCIASPRGMNVFMRGRDMSYRVLVADSSSTTRENILQALNEMEINNGTAAGDGETAIDLFSRDQFDLVLIDWDLETDSGRNVVDEIRTLDRDIPIIALTNETDQQRETELDKSGDSDVLVTPFTMDDFRKKLDRFMPAKTK